MIKFLGSMDELKESIQKIGITIDIDSVAKLNFPFFDNQEKYTLLSIPGYDELLPKNILFLSKKENFVYSNIVFNNYEKTFKSILKKPYGESTVIAYLLLKNIIKVYSREFEKIREGMNLLDLNPLIDKIEESGRSLRRLTDRFEELVQVILTLKEKDLKEFNAELLSSDYEILSAEARYLLERCRSHIYRVASLRTKCEMNSNKELNATMSRLTVIMTFLTIAGIVVSVPGTIGAVFGIPALSNAYFEPNTTLLVLILICSTLLSLALGYAYWTSLGLRYKK